LARDKGGYVYILASKRNGTLYIGVTADLLRRVWQHKNDEVPGFTSRHGVKRLVWHERYDDIRDAIAREKAMKKWRRAWKVTLIEESNQSWEDLYPEASGFPPTRE